VVTEGPDPMSSDEAKKRSWARLRRAHQHKQDNPEAREWREIGVQNHFGPSFQLAIIEALSRREPS
jgi:hypothetical protein